MRAICSGTVRNNSSDRHTIRINFQQEPCSFMDFENKFLEIVRQLVKFSPIKTELGTVRKIEEIQMEEE